MCGDRLSVGLVEDGGRDLSHVISTTAHELGHIFGMNHDTCEQIYSAEKTLLTQVWYYKI